MTSQAIEMITKPRVGLLYFYYYTELHDWIFDNKESITKAGGVYHASLSQIKFPNGNTLVLGHGEINKYISYEFMFVLNCPELQWRVRL